MEHFIRHGDQLTLVQIVTDPAYLEMPLIRTMDFVLNPVVTNRPAATRFEIVDEIPDLQKGYVASYALGTRHTDWARFVGLPWEASRGGKDTLLPRVSADSAADGQGLSGVAGRGKRRNRTDGSR